MFTKHLTGTWVWKRCRDLHTIIMAVQQLQRNNKKDNGQFYGAQKDTIQYGKSLIKTYIKNAINGHFYGAWSLAKSTAQCRVQKDAKTTNKSVFINKV